MLLLDLGGVLLGGLRAWQFLQALSASLHRLRCPTHRQCQLAALCLCLQLPWELSFCLLTGSQPNPAVYW